MRILVVEDDPVILNGLTTGLSLHRMVADGVDTCEDAYAALAAEDFNAVVLDWMLPDGSGIDVLRHAQPWGHYAGAVADGARRGARPHQRTR